MSRVGESNGEMYRVQQVKVGHNCSTMAFWPSAEAATLTVMEEAGGRE